MAKAENKIKEFKPQQKKVQQAQRALILAEGVITEAVKISGISYPTFKRYLRAGLIDPSIKVDGSDQVAALDKLATDQNQELAKLMLETAEDAVSQTRAELHAASAKDAAIIAGVMIDKSRILEGKATHKVQVDVSASLEVLERYGVVQVIDDPNVIEGEVIDDA